MILHLFFMFYCKSSLSLCPSSLLSWWEDFLKDIKEEKCSEILDLQVAYLISYYLNFKFFQCNLISSYDYLIFHLKLIVSIVLQNTISELWFLESLECKSLCLHMFSICFLLFSPLHSVSLMYACLHLHMQTGLHVRQGVGLLSIHCWVHFLTD